MTSTAPTVVVIGGPNGAGKSTIAPAIIERAFGRIEFVNADTIARGLSGLDPDRQAFAAGRITLRHIKDLAESRRSFSFESTLASRSFAPFLKRLNDQGWRVHVLYVWVQSSEIAIERVQRRVASGGHAVPNATIRRRFTRSAANFIHLYLPLASAWEILDNSSHRHPSLIAAGGVGQDMMVSDLASWNALKEHANAL